MENIRQTLKTGQKKTGENHGNKENFWKTKENIGWVFNISQKIKDLGYDVLKTYEIEMLHIDGNKEVIKYPNTQQKFRYPFYFKTMLNKTTNYKTIKY